MFGIHLKPPGSLLTVLIILLPIGTSTAGNVLNNLGQDWHTGADAVALVSGIIGGLFTALGSFWAGWLCDKMNKKYAYLLVGLVQAACCTGMAVSPRSELMYIIWTLFYSMTAGLTYTAFYAVMLDTIGAGAAATKGEILACISNIPIYYMTLVAGSTASKWGSGGMLYTEQRAMLFPLHYFWR